MSDQAAIQKQARRMAVGAMLLFAVFGGAMVTATLRQNSRDASWQGPPSCPPVTVGDVVDAKVQPAADSSCRRMHESGINRIVSAVQYGECADGRRLYVIDRREVAGLEDEERIALHGFTGGTFEAGVPSEAATATCKGTNR